MKNADKPINPIYSDGEIYGGLAGLTKREYFAGLAMQGLLSEVQSTVIKSLESGVNKNDIIKASGAKSIAQSAIQYADELLKQLEG
jgi:hypothetical protein